MTTLRRAAPPLKRPKREEISSEDEDDFGMLSQTDNPNPRSQYLQAAMLTDVPDLFQGRKRAIHDAIHGHIELHPLMMEIIDTPEFQRLRYLKQLGGTAYVYPSANHPRFPHCIGVSHLAGEMVEHLQRSQPDLGITERDVLCLRVAGLCHDLGHGPFSHMFELFINRLRQKQGKGEWCHEDASIKLLDYLLEANDINLESFGLQMPDDLNFIKLLIVGLKPQEPWPTNIGRPERKRFLFEIVSNKRNGLDVDKIDYFLRDSTVALGQPPITCDFGRIIRTCRVLEVEGQMQICFEEKMALGIFDLYRLRVWLHTYLYQHHAVNTIEEMICDVLTEADDHFHPVTGLDGSKLKMSEAIDDMMAYASLGDWVLNALEASNEPELARAREILLRIRKRQLYRTLDRPIDLTGRQEHADARDIEAEIIELLPPGKEDAGKDLIVHLVFINYGSKNKDRQSDNPLDHIMFFNPKQDLYTAGQLKKRVPPLFAPTSFHRTMAYAYSRSDDNAAVLQEAYRKWRAAIIRRDAVLGAEETLAIGNPPSPSQNASCRLMKHRSTERNRVDVSPKKLVPTKLSLSSVPEMLVKRSAAASSLE